MRDELGKRVKLIRLVNELDPILPGMEGLIVGQTDDILYVKWDNGRTLNLIIGKDVFVLADTP